MQWDIKAQNTDYWYLRKKEEGPSMSWGGDIVWRYFAPFSALVFDVGLVRGPASRLYGFCFHSGLPYVHFTDRENIKTGVKHISKKNYTRTIFMNYCAIHTNSTQWMVATVSHPNGPLRNRRQLQWVQKVTSKGCDL